MEFPNNSPPTALSRAVVLYDAQRALRTLTAAHWRKLFALLGGEDGYEEEIQADPLLSRWRLMFHRLTGNDLRALAVNSSISKMIRAVLKLSLRNITRPYRDIEPWLASHADLHRSCSIAAQTDTKFPQEVMLLIIDNMDNGALHLFAGTCQAYHNVIVELYKRRIAHMLATFTIHPLSFFAMLETTDAMISGSAALAVMFPGAFKPGDLDLYVPHDNARIVSAHLKTHCGYQEAEDPKAHYTSSSYTGVVVTKVTLFTKGDCSVHVVSILGDNAAIAIFDFHSTIVMNFVSSHGLYCAYPALTFKRRGLINVEGAMDSTQRVCIDKYVDRGFDLQRRLSAWEIDPEIKHVCGSSTKCPRTLRTMHDSGGSFMSFTPFGTSDGSRYSSRASVSWLLQCGSWCYRGKDTTGDSLALPIEMLAP